MDITLMQQTRGMGSIISAQPARIFYAALLVLGLAYSHGAHADYVCSTSAGNFSMQNPIPQVGLACGNGQISGVTIWVDWSGQGGVSVLLSAASASSVRIRRRRRRCEFANAAATAWWP